MRKIIQISTSGAVQYRAGEDSNWSLTALCDDGTVWCATEYSSWVKQDPIPQDKEIQDL